jgi:hypothetical protein
MNTRSDAPTHLKKLAEWLGISTFDFSQPVRREVNDRYSALWRGGSDAGGARDEKETQRLADFFAQRARTFGYRMDDLKTIHPLTGFGTLDSSEQGWAIDASSYQIEHDFATSDLPLCWLSEARNALL